MSTTHRGGGGGFLGGSEDISFVELMESVGQQMTGSFEFEEVSRNIMLANQTLAWRAPKAQPYQHPDLENSLHFLFKTNQSVLQNTCGDLPITTLD